MDFDDGHLESVERRSTATDRYGRSATWEGEADLDISIVTNQGTRISWLGGRRDSFGSGSLAKNGEVLGVGRAVVGSYSIEIARASSDAGQEPVKGKLVIKALDVERDVELELRKPSARLARVSITRETRLVAE